jgi:hypothetical protein
MPVIDIPDDIDDLDPADHSPDGIHDGLNLEPHGLDDGPEDQPLDAHEQHDGQDDHHADEHEHHNDLHHHGDGHDPDHAPHEPGHSTDHAEYDGEPGHEHPAGETHYHPPAAESAARHVAGHFDHFDPNSDGAARDVIGHPADDMAHWHQQHYEDTCNVSCEEFILDAVTGHHHSEDDLAREATARGWYQPGGGTPPIHVGELLEAHGVPIHREFGCTFDGLVEKLQDGEKVIVGVQSEAIRSPGADDHLPLTDYVMGIPSQFANHAVEVIGVKGAGTDHAMLILNDPGSPDGRGLMVPAEQFEHAWAPSGHFMVSTAVHEDHSAGHDQPRFGGYYNADGTYHHDSANTGRDEHTGAVARRW